MWNSNIVVPLVFAGTKQALSEINILKSENIQLKSRCERLEYMLEQAFDRIAEV